MRRLSLLLLGVGVVLLFAVPTSADPPDKTRVVVLEPVEGHWALGIPWSKAHPNPSAKVSIHYWGNSGLQGPDCHLLVKGARVLWREQSYALYFTTRNSPEEYVHGEAGSGRFLFNMSWVGVYENWTGGCGANDEPPTLTFFIAVEYDDGRPFMPHLDMDKVVFVGTDVLE
jgi:hypothetical protein